MSWILIFISTYVPMVILAILVLVDRLHRERQSSPARAGLRGC